MFPKVHGHVAAGIAGASKACFRAIRHFTFSSRDSSPTGSIANREAFHKKLLIIFVLSDLKILLLRKEIMGLIVPSNVLQIVQC